MHKKDQPDCGLTRLDLIKSIASGETLSSIEKAWGMKYNTIHVWVKKWDLKGITAAKAQDLLKEMGEDANAKTKVTDPEDTGSKTDAVSPAEGGTNPDPAVEDKIPGTNQADPGAGVDEIRQENAEIVRLKQEVIGLTVALCDSDVELDKLHTDIHLKDNRIASLVNERDNAQAAANALYKQLEQNVSDPGSAGYLTLRIPIIDAGSNSLDQINKVYEELKEFCTELEATPSDRRRMAAELIDLVQAFAGLIRVELSELIVTGDVDKLQQAFFDHHNAEHETKIRRYAADRGWVMADAVLGG